MSRPAGGHRHSGGHQRLGGGLAGGQGQRPRQPGELLLRCAQGGARVCRPARCGEAGVPATPAGRKSLIMNCKPGCILVHSVGHDGPLLWGCARTCLLAALLWPLSQELPGSASCGCGLLSGPGASDTHQQHEGAMATLTLHSHCPGCPPCIEQQPPRLHSMGSSARNFLGAESRFLGIHHLLDRCRVSRRNV